MTPEVGLPPTTIRRIWGALGLQPHRSETFKLSSDPLLAALDNATGTVIGKYYKRHRATEFLDFLKHIDAAMPEDPEVHLVIANYATDRTPRIKAWLARRPQWHVRFTPMSASRINQVDAGSSKWCASSCSAKFTPRGDRWFGQHQTPGAARPKAISRAKAMT